MKKNLIIIFLTVLVLGLCGYLVYNKVIDRKEIGNNNETTIISDDKKQEISLNEKFKDLYAFKIDNSSIYALLTNGHEELLVNYKNDVCNNKECGTIEYEYINGVFYLYHIGSQDSTYSVNEKANVDVYSIDLTKEEIKATKEYEISKNGEYIDTIKQDNDAFYYVSFAPSENENIGYNSKVFKYIKNTKEIQEVYDFKGYIVADDDAYGVLAVYNNNLYIVSDISYGHGSDSNQKIYNINLNDNSVKTIAENLFVSYYDNIENKIISKVQGNKSLKIVNLKDLSINEVSENEIIENRYYSIGNKLAYYVNTNTIKITGGNNYSIDLQKYTDKKIKENYSNLVLWSDYSVMAIVYLEGVNQPEIFKINLNTGNVQKTDMTFDDINNCKYLYIK